MLGEVGTACGAKSLVVRLRPALGREAAPCELLRLPGGVSPGEPELELSAVPLLLIEVLAVLASPPPAI
jgi:hypothetical protein